MCKGKVKEKKLEELCLYHRQRRSYEYDAHTPLKSSWIKKKIYRLTKTILKIDRLIMGRELIVFDDKRLRETNKGKVFAATHVGRYDIKSVMEAIDEQAYFIMGDPGETYRNFEGFFLDNMYGRICFDTGYEISDLFAKHRAGIPFTIQLTIICLIIILIITNHQIQLGIIRKHLIQSLTIRLVIMDRMMNL